MPDRSPCHDFDPFAGHLPPDCGVGSNGTILWCPLDYCYTLLQPFKGNSTPLRPMHANSTALKADDEEARSQLTPPPPPLTPQFPATWDVRQSTWVMACNYSGFLRPEITSAFGVVDLGQSSITTLIHTVHSSAQCTAD